MHKGPGGGEGERRSLIRSSKQFTTPGAENSRGMMGGQVLMRKSQERWAEELGLRHFGADAHTRGALVVCP